MSHRWTEEKLRTAVSLLKFYTKREVCEHLDITLPVLEGKLAVIKFQMRVYTVSTTWIHRKTGAGRTTISLVRKQLGYPMHEWLSLPRALEVIKRLKQHELPTTINKLTSAINELEHRMESIDYDGYL